MSPNSHEIPEAATVYIVVLSVLSFLSIFVIPFCILCFAYWWYKKHRAEITRIELECRSHIHSNQSASGGSAAPNF